MTESSDFDVKIVIGLEKPPILPGLRIESTVNSNWLAGNGPATKFCRTIDLVES